MNVVIVAGGLGTRFKDLSIFPKVLLPILDYDSIISKQLAIFDKVSLIINDKFYDMTNNYLEVNNLNNKITLYKTNNSNGSYNSIKDVIDNYEDFPKDDVLFVWSDLILNKVIKVTNNTIFTYNGNYRYAFDGNEIKQRSEYDGNVPGVYYIKSISDIFTIDCNSKTNYDLIDRIKDSNLDFEKCDIDELIEIRDYDTYIKYTTEKNNNGLKTRFFNKLEIVGDKLVKRAIDKKYYNIIEKEFDWYKFGYNNIDGFSKIVPNIDLGSFRDHSFSMSYLKDYIPLHKCLNILENNEDICKLYDNIYRVLDILHASKKIVSKDVFYRDLKKEVIDKVIERCENIKHILLNYDKEHLYKVLNNTFQYLLSLESGDSVEYSFTHGDINGSNLLVNPKSLDVKLIDPRGYFGFTTLYGWPKYEYAKLLYCLYGYDDFNNNIKIYKKDWPTKFKWCEDIEFLNKKEYKVLVGIIYVALAGYISQDIMKANIAYEYGLELLKNTLSYD